MSPNSSDSDIKKLENEIAELRIQVKQLKSYLESNNQFLDFSQLGEQQVLINIIERIAAQKNIPPFYLDIGGFHPIIGSNTFKLHQLGWRGIVVEPNQEKLMGWEQTRPNDVTICAAVIPDSWDVKTVSMACSNNFDARESVVSSLNNNNRQNSAAKTNNYDASTIKFKDLMAYANDKQLFPTLLNLDIEGLEEEITLSSDLGRYKIPLLCIEHFLNEFTNEQSLLAYSESKLVNALEASGYYLVSVCGVSLVFCHRDYWISYS